MIVLIAGAMETISKSKKSKSNPFTAIISSISHSYGQSINGHAVLYLKFT